MVNVDADILSVTSGTSGMEIVWQAFFSLGVLADSGQIGSMHATLVALSERIASSTAIAFSEQLRSDLLARGARPGGNFVVTALVLDDLENPFNTSDSAIGWWWLVIILVVLTAVGFIVIALRRAFTEEPAAVIVSPALWELEMERWELAEKVLEAPEPPAMPKEWKAEGMKWVVSSEKPLAAKTAAAPGGPRFYNLTFGAGGSLEGWGEGAEGAFQVNGAFDATDGNIRWRESQESGGVVECYGQIGEWDGIRIDGFFVAFDISTLPQQIGQGNFVLSTTGNAKGARLTGTHSLTLASPELQKARSDMV